MKRIALWLTGAIFLTGLGGCVQIFVPANDVSVQPTDSATPSPSPQLTPSATPKSTTTLYVDSETGSDRHPGTAEQPLKTITQALNQAQSGTVIVLRPGVYSANTGEIFPLVIKSGVRLQGNPETQGKDIQITGGGKFLSPTWAGQNVTILAGPETQVAGLTVTNPNTRGTAIWVETGSPTIEKNRFVGSDREGVFVSGSATPNIWFNIFEQNGGNGLVFTRDSGGLAQDNVIQNQGFGIAIGDRARPVIRANQIRQNKDGMVINGESRPTLDRNQIGDNSRDGMVVTNNAKPVLTANTFANNGDYDLHNATRAPLQVEQTNLAALKVQGPTE
jgi:parallel beta-helix repeat protein